MGKPIRCVGYWVEVIPALVISPEKPSNTPSLETIREEGTEEYEYEDDDS
uniref:Uncharacterized protein n=1 Tax=Nelumbo nucifera TaxID=4432 RepID=A0A822Y4D7_NELNU|nr:TPA_asm: hypothetical protein HUJ06_027647 [Nelumbo nucifera]